MTRTTAPAFSDLLDENHPQPWGSKERAADVQAALLSGNPYRMRAAAIVTLLTSELLPTLETRGLHTITALIDEIDKTRPDIALWTLCDVEREYDDFALPVPAGLNARSPLASRLLARLHKLDLSHFDDGRCAPDQAPFLSLAEAASTTRDIALCALTLHTITRKAYSPEFIDPPRTPAIRDIARNHMRLDPEHFIRSVTSCCFYPAAFVHDPNEPYADGNYFPLEFDKRVAPLIQAALRRVDNDRLSPVAAFICNSVAKYLAYDHAERIAPHTVRLLSSTLRRLRRHAPQHYPVARDFISRLAPPSPHRPPPRRQPAGLRRALRPVA